MSIFLPVIFFIAILLFLPIKIELVLNVKLKENKLEFEPISNLKNYVKIKILFFLQVFKKDIFEEKRKPKRQNVKPKSKKVLAKAAYNSIKFERFILSLGINTFNPILNSYINAGLNTGICMYINKESKKFNFNALYYQIYLSDIPCAVSTDISIYFSLPKFFIEYLKVKLKEKKCSASKMNKEYLKNV